MVIAKGAEGDESIKYEADPKDRLLTRSNACRGEAKILGCTARAIHSQAHLRYENILIISSVGPRSQAHQKMV